jgi:hypothetical protein
MRRIFLMVAAALLFGAPAFAQQTSTSTEGRPPDAKFDNSTADQAKKRLEAAGWREVTGLRKGYDGTWHGLGTKDGVRRRVALTAAGIFLDGD